MAALNVSLSFFFVTVALCQAARRASKALLSVGAYTSFSREAAGVAQLGACCLEMQMLAEIRSWAGGFSPDLLVTLIFLAHGITFDGASANPTVSLQELLLAEASLPSTLLKLVAQGLGMQAACALPRLYWAWELSDLQVLQSLLDTHCSSALHTTVPHGALLEGACASLFHLTLLHLRSSLPMYRVPAVALLVNIMAYTEQGARMAGAPGLHARPRMGALVWGLSASSQAGPFTSAFFSPALAASLTFHCSGLTWLGPLTARQALWSDSWSPAGMVLAVLLYQGHLPRLFQRNLLYSQRNKYRTPRGKLAPGPGDTRTAEGYRGQEPGWSRVGPS
ncbi:hypothetical protein MC885_004742 [Smutsia gigantea]|nr:hypothetical protein MC885_004742 [Smutsia gigantea]